MGKKQRERKLQKLAQKPRGNAPLTNNIDVFGGTITPQAQALIDRLSRAPNLSETRMMQMLIDSAELRAEPEFQDLFFDLDETARVMENILPRHATRIQRATAKSEDAAHQAYDDARIEMLDALATRAFRRDFLERFDRMLKRMLAEPDAEYLETALVLRPFLQEKKIPWGIIGLVLEIFQDSQDSLLEPLVQTDALVAEVMESLGEQGTAEELRARLEDPAEREALVRKLEANPALDEKLTERIDALMDSFESDIERGLIELQLFTLDEAATTLSAMMQYNHAHNITPDNTDEDAQRERSEEFIAHALDEIVTPERLDVIEMEMRKIHDAWQAAGNPHAMLLNMEIDFLRETKPSDNPLFYAVYRRAMTEVLNGLQTLVAEIGAGTFVPSETTSPAFLERIGNIFKRN